MQSWTEVRLQMLAWGFRRVLTIEIDCPRCGLYRAELWEELEFYPCPGCAHAAKVCHILEGYTRRTVISAEWIQVEKPLSDKARRWILSESELLSIARPLARVRKQRARSEAQALKAYRKGQNLGVINTRSASRL
jgi:hypothetical protein